MCLMFGHETTTDFCLKLHVLLVSDRCCRSSLRYLCVTWQIAWEAVQPSCTARSAWVTGSSRTNQGKFLPISSVFALRGKKFLNLTNERRCVVMRECRKDLSSDHFVGCAAGSGAVYSDRPTPLFLSFPPVVMKVTFFGVLFQKFIQEMTKQDK